MISEAVENKANEVLLGMLQGVEQAGDFVVTQAPDVIRELLLWHTVSSLIGFTVGAFLLVSSPVAWAKLSGFLDRKKQSAIDAYERGDAWTRYSPGGSITSVKYDRIMETNGFIGPSIGVTWVVFGLIFIIGNLAWLKIMVAPKLYLLEYAANLVK